ncbi:MAG: IgGFc-binding protein, partial [Chitinophagaceae bacterium]
MCSNFSFGQDFTNKGKDFWVGYGSHVRMYHTTSNDPDKYDLNKQNMVLYFTSDRDANVVVEIPGLSNWRRLYSVKANKVTASEIMPKGTSGIDARLMTEGKSTKGIHITSDVPIIAYAHIYNGNQSGATLLFPTPTLGRDYYSLNYKQVSNENDSYSYAFVIATEDNTDVEIIPSAKTKGDPGYPSRLKGDTIKVKLNKGEIYNILGEQTSISYNGMGQIVKTTGNDLTGTRIRSVGTCRRIAVFSGTGKMSISCSNNASSSDNFIQQVMPLSVWGKKYLTVPTSGMEFNFYRILAPQNSNNVKVNGVLQNGKIDGMYYEVSGNTPLLIESDEPILVAQYISSQNSCGNPSPYNLGDPEMIYLSPVEQTINKITINSTPFAAIKIHFINIIIENSSINSLRIDGNIPIETPKQHPGDPDRVYLQVRLNEGSHTIEADKGFNAIAYGYGEYESYGYNAGTLVKDLSQYIVLKNAKAEVNYPITCTNSPFKISIVLPYITPKIRWTSKDLFLDSTTLNPSYVSIFLPNGITA